MDFIFEVILPKDISIESAVFNQDVFLWNGFEYPQGLPYFDYNPMFRLIKTPIPNHLPKIIPEILALGEWQCYLIEGCGLDERYYNVKNGLDDKSSISSLLGVMLKGASRWIVIMEAHGDQIDYIKSGKKEDAVKLIDKSLSVTGEGFVLWGSQNSRTQTMDSDTLRLKK